MFAIGVRLIIQSYSALRLIPRRLLLCLLFALTLSGCSSTQLAYRQLDWVSVWWVEDYIPLTDDQEATLDSHISNHLQWHCSQELPRYRAWLSDVASVVRQPIVSPEDVAREQARVGAAIKRLLQEIAPTATGLLASLNDDQVAALDRAMRESQQEKQDELLGDSPEERRQERTVERAERWLGPLTGEQEKVIADWNRARGNQTAVWLEGRQRWHDALRYSLQFRQTPQFPQKIKHLLLQSTGVRGPEYEAMMAQSLQALNHLVADLINQATPAQRTHLLETLDELQSDFRELTCAPASRTGTQAAISR